MKRIYKIDETCKRLKCKSNNVRQKLTEELSNEIMPSTYIMFNQLDDNTLEVNLWDNK